MILDTNAIFWGGAAVLYATSALGFILSYFFYKKRLVEISLFIAAVGLILHTAAILMRWAGIGYGPFIGFFDAMSSYAWLAVVVYLALLIWKRSLKALGLVVLPIAFVALATALSTTPSDLGITPALASIWLVAHVIFAATAVTAMVIAFSLAVVYLLRDRGKTVSVLKQLPGQTELDNLIFKCISVGFILWTIMIIIGAIWANEAWGRYWGWDPIETWSLIAWIVYAICLHLRLTRGWIDRKFAYLAMAALPIMVFALIGVPFVWDSIHAAYLDVG